MLTEKQKELANIDLSQFGPRERTSIRLYGLKNKDWDQFDAIEYYHTWLPNATEVEIPMTVYEEAEKWCRDNIYIHEYKPVTNTRGPISEGTVTLSYKEPNYNYGTISFKHPEDAFIFKMRYI